MKKKRAICWICRRRSKRCLLVHGKHTRWRCPRCVARFQ